MDMNFGPNGCIYSEDMKNVGSSHRSDFAKYQYRLLQENMRNKIPGLKDFDIIFVFGSSSLAMEIIISSLQNKIELTSKEGKFEQRWDTLISRYAKTGDLEIYKLGVQYETSLNKLNEVENCDIIDAVCSFPLFDFPKSAKIVVGCANKMLGLGMGLSFIFLGKLAAFLPARNGRCH